MLVVEDPADLPVPSGRRGFVPTLGNLHAGHVSLIEAAQKRADEVVVSIYVNPTQFRPGEDYERYPRTPEQDLQICERAAVNYVFMPSSETMYPAGDNAISIHIADIGDRWEGELRPGHFDGVAIVVANLFLAIKPHFAVFGQKDLQQNAVIKQLTNGLRLGVELCIEPTVREPDGLALSSRNSYLSAGNRKIAPQVYWALREASSVILRDPTADCLAQLTAIGQRLDPQFTLQYFALVNRDTMDITAPQDPRASLIIAALLDETRLIDNMALRG